VRNVFPWPGIRRSSCRKLVPSQQESSS
jgi:hypothetical protein